MLTLPKEHPRYNEWQSELFFLEIKQQIQSIHLIALMKNYGMTFALWPHTMWQRKNCVNVKWGESVKNLTEPYNGHFENLTEPYSKENKTLQNLTQHLFQVVVTLYITGEEQVQN